MILRRVIAHFRKREWTAIAIDFVIVVLGVFVGIQASNWNEGRRERSLEATYLHGLATDLAADVAEIDEISRVATARLSALNFVLTEATGRGLPEGFLSARGRIEIEPAPPFSEKAFGSAGVALFILTTLEGNRLTYESMINTGGVGLIRDGALLRDVQSYYATAESVRDFEASAKESRLALVDEQQEAGLSPVDETPAAELAAAFAKDRRLVAAAKNYWLYTNRHLKLMRDLKTRAEALRARLAEESEE